MAGDDPTGYAISGRMRQQLRSLERCKTNATTGKSLCETADAALEGITDILHRLEELSVKAANGTLTESDREKIQSEADELTKEIKRISTTTELNSQIMFDGTFVNKGYTNNKDVSVVSYSDKTDIKDYPSLSIKEEFNGSNLEVTVSGFTSDDIKLSVDYPQYVDRDRTTVISGVSYDTTIVTTGLYIDGGGNGSIKIAEDGSQLITVNGNNGESITFKINKGMTKDGEYVDTTYTPDGGTPEPAATKGPTPFDTGSLNVKLTGDGAMRIQVGANTEEYIKMTLPEMSLEKLDLDDIYLKSEAGASNAIEKVKHALEYVTKARSVIGSYQNRIEQAISYIDVSSENLTQTYSRITDTDMAEEMIKYSNSQILVQAATTILAQANKMPQQTLELLQ